MEMCPYCGEDVPDDSGSCWKCGTELSGSGVDDDDADDDDDGSGELELEQRRPKSDVPQGDCPFCGATVSARALRCNECGRAIRKVKHGKNWVPAVYSAFGLVVVGLIVGLFYSFFANAREAPDPGRDTPIPFTYEKLAKIYTEGRQTPRLRELWSERHEGKFVEWEMVILEVREDGSLALAGSRTADPEKPEVVLLLKDPDLVAERGLKKEKAIAFSAALQTYEGRTFHLDLGKLVEEE